MKGKLIKTDKQEYRLYTNDSLPFATTDNSPYKKLSLKNCEAIELGYDLDGLADEYAKYMNDDDGTSDIDFKVGFQKALEILKDKKFSEDDIRQTLYLKNGFDKNGFSFYKSDEEIIQSLQQTEWNIEVVTDKIPADLAPGGWDVFPKLDADGCLILKRIE